jgi:hypothetical protein
MAVSDLMQKNKSTVSIEKGEKKMKFRTIDMKFAGWVKANYPVTR